MMKARRTKAQGHVQRASASSAPHAAPSDLSHLAPYLLEDYAFGKISAHQAQPLANIAKLASPAHPSWDKLESFGTGGRHANNIDRDLRHDMQSYLHPIKKPSPESVSMLLKLHKGKDTDTHLIPHDFLPPHKLIKFIFSEFQSYFKSNLLGTDEEMAEC